MCTYSPVMKCHGIESNNEIYIKRDDLIPFAFGGNKARIAEEFFADMKRSGKNCMIGYGSTKSNLCRVLANMCYSKGIKCHIINSEENADACTETNNSRLVKACGATVHYCTKNNVAEIVEQVMLQCEAEGYSPYYIYGNKFGKGNEAVPVQAYVKAHSEITGQYDYIFLATGTGMTQAGLLAGKRLNGTNEKIVGISVARGKIQATDTIREYLSAYYENQGLHIDLDDEILVEDSYSEGYGLYTPYILDTIKLMYLTNGIPLDTTYTGKAFAGMLSYIKEKHIVGKRILFLHTGGTPLFWDNVDDIFRQRITRSMLEEFVQKIDLELPVPLSQRVDIEKYVDKLYEKAHIVSKVENGKVVSAVIGYTENLIGNMSYITLVGTLPEGRHKGYAAEVLEEYISDCKRKNIDGIHLHTELHNTSAICLYKKHGFICWTDKCEENSSKLHMVCRF